MIFVADALRYDYLPKSIAKAGNVIKTLAPSLYTPTSFASLVTAKSPENHNVRTFFDSLDMRLKTVFDVFEYGSYYDHPNDPMCKIVLRHCPSPKELTEMEEPFVWVERAMDTHIPYGHIKHGNEVKNTTLAGKEYQYALYSRKLDARKEYKEGVEEVERHFWSHIDELKDTGVLERTLIIFTSDHGELLGEFGRFTHNYPPCRELVEVPTVFLGTNLNVEFMRSIDIIPTALGILKPKRYLDGCDGVDIRLQEPKKAVNLTKTRLTVWECHNKKIRLVSYYRRIPEFRLMRNKWVRIPIPLAIFSRRLLPMSTSATLKKDIQDLLI